MVEFLKVIDEYFGSAPEIHGRASTLRLASERTTAREIIFKRLQEEVEEENERILKESAPRRGRSLIVDVQHTSAEARLNPLEKGGSDQTRLLDAEGELQRAFAAFKQQRFVMLFDGKQIEELDTELVVTPHSEMVFLHLTPLRGG